MSGKEFAKRYAKRKHALRLTVIYNCRVYYEINEENRGEVFKHNDFESFDIDNIYNLYHSKLILKNRKKKL